VRNTESQIIAAAAPTTTRTTTPGEVHLEGAPGDTSAVRIAKFVLGPLAANSLTATTYTRRLFGKTELQDAVNALNSSVASVQSGNLVQVEAVLMAQSMALNAIFNELAVRSYGQEQMKHLEPLLRLALKAQSQSRMTLETLATLKNPLVVFAKQANISNGHQQVNNSASHTPRSRTVKAKTRETKLLEKQHGERLDAGEKGTTGRTDSELETVGKLDGPAKRAR
jgi:hypothetical protein